MNMPTFRSVCISAVLFALTLPVTAPAQQASHWLQADWSGMQPTEPQRPATPGALQATDIPRPPEWLEQLQRQGIWTDTRYAPTPTDLFRASLAYYPPRRAYRQSIRYGYLGYPAYLYPPPYAYVPRSPSDFYWNPGHSYPFGGKTSETRPPIMPAPTPAPMPEAIPAPPSDIGPRDF